MINWMKDYLSGREMTPYKTKHTNKLERIQRIATKMVPELKYLYYEDRLKEMQLTKLQV